MIRKIRKSRLSKVICAVTSISFLSQMISPSVAFGLTGGPAQPEFNSFTPIGTSDMVDLSSGDMSYNIPLMDVGGYPLNMAYNAGVGMDQEASWVGLGWNLSVGQINRNVRGLPDDFKGDKMLYENYQKPNVTVGGSFKFTPALFGVEVAGGAQQVVDEPFTVSLGMSAMYNNYSGFTMKPSVGIQVDLAGVGSVGANVESGPEGMSISPNLSLHTKNSKKKKRNQQLGLNAGVSFNSRQGLTSTTLGMSRKTQQGFLKFKKKVVGDKKRGSSMSLGSSISFTDQLYTPSKRVAMETGSFTVNAALGAEVFGGEGQGQVTAYGTVMKVADTEKNVAAYGYNNTGEANEYSVLDFNREKDGAFSVNSTNMPLTNYTYDIYSVQGQGVSGMYRPFRNQVGYVYDTKVTDASFAGTFGFEVGTGNSVHAGLDIEASGTVSHSGLWSDNNFAKDYFEQDGSSLNYEKVHHKNVGDLSVDQDFNMFDEGGRYHPVRIPFNGGKFNRKAISQFNEKNQANGSENAIDINSKIKRSQRQRRNQAILNLTVQDVGQGKGFGPMVSTPQHPQEYTFPTDAKPHHTAEVQIIRNDGARYIYGLPVYNLTKKEATFAVDKTPNCNTGLVNYDKEELVDKDGWKDLPNDKYFNRITTPAYVHTHLLTSVLSTDYADRDGDGPTVDDFGSYTKFSYKSYEDLNGGTNKYRWRVPYGVEEATYNEGFKTEPTDDQGNYVYGEKEMYYIDKIETKTHIAIFHYTERQDAKGVLGEDGGYDPSQNSYKLDKISLYSVGEYDPNNVDPQDPTINLSTPIKEAHFEYSYALCTGVPNNAGGFYDGNGDGINDNYDGKLTLKKVYFTYRNSLMGKYTGYRFNYGEFEQIEYPLGSGNFIHPDGYTPNIQPSQLVINSNYNQNVPGSGLNPVYNVKAYDFWGNYLPNEGGCANLDPITAPEFSFTSQNKTVQDVRSQVWSMQTISLPSGGEINIDYESDSYSHVQNKKVNRMFKVHGAGRVSDGTAVVEDGLNSGSLFKAGPLNTPNNYIYVEVDPDENVNLSTAEIEAKYLTNLTEPIYFRFLTNMTALGSASGLENAAKYDYVTGYVDYDANGTAQVFEANNTKYISIPVKLVDKEGGLGGGSQVNPMAKAGWHFARKYLSRHAYSTQPNGDSDDIEAIVVDLLSPQVLNNLIAVFTGPNGELENKGVARRFIKEKSWVRLVEPDGEKLGGGCRVKEIRMSDVWEEMNPGQGDYQTMNYGQKYEYTLEDGTTSGVATYEPVGNKENPFVQPVFATTKHKLAPDEENFVEKPFGESFFPSPKITYARVTVANLQAGEQHPDPARTVKQLHKTGKVVTEFYTCRDYPTVVDQTKLQAEEDKQELLDNILKLNVRKHFTASQGYVVHLNDMDGKQKSQRVFAEGQDVAISGVDYIYDNYTTPTGFTAAAEPERVKGKLDNNVPVINEDGTVEVRTIGVEVDLVNDFRENRSKTQIPGINANLASFFVGVIPGLVPIPLPDYSQTEDQFRSVSTTKVINTFGILKETIAYDAGAAVYTRNLAWDAKTGEVLVTETVDEFNDKYYTLNFPAHWHYSGMDQAALNLGLEGTINNVSGANYELDGVLSNLSDYLHVGDEIYMNGIDEIGWVTSITGNQFSMIRKDGSPISGYFGANQDSEFKLVRSGHRNLQSAGIMNITLMRNPIDNGLGGLVSTLGTNFLEESTWDIWRIINAGAVDYSDDWAAGCECGIQPGVEGINPNPFCQNEKGVWRTKSSRTYLTGRNRYANATPRVEGFFSTFQPMYKLQGGNWVKDFNGWTFVSEVTSYSPYGFELENMDALRRFSAAQYGYNNVFPIAVGANTKYKELGYDGFEDRSYEACPYSSHFSFEGEIVDTKSHSGKHSMKVAPASSVTMTKKLSCKTGTGGVKPVTEKAVR